MDITLTELEQAINYWRLLKPSLGEEHALSIEVNALATIYAKMIFTHQKAVPVSMLDATCQQLIDQWRTQRIDA